MKYYFQMFKMHVISLFFISQVVAGQHSDDSQSFDFSCMVEIEVDNVYN